MPDFHASAEDMSLDNHTLKARLRDGNGEWRDAEINLNDFLGNEDGHFFWGGNNFSESAQDISLSIEGAGVPVLRAQLTTGTGETRQADVNLAEMLSNYDGQFRFD